MFVKWIGKNQYTIFLKSLMSHKAVISPLIAKENILLFINLGVFFGLIITLKHNLQLSFICKRGNNLKNFLF